jgi:hypothetical protein
MRKDTYKRLPVLHLYLELEPEGEPRDGLVAHVHEALMDCDPFYRDLDQMLEMRPLKITLLAEGSFQRLYQARGGPDYTSAGAKHRMNPSEEFILDLLRADAL